MEYTVTVPARAALRSRRNTMGHSSSGSKPASSTAGARSRSEYVTAAWPATRSARNCSSSADSGRARMSMSLLASATRANLA